MQDEWQAAYWRKRSLRLALATLTAAAAFALAAPALAAEATCPNEQFRVGPSSALPDCRAYEIVSPPGVEPWFQTNSFGKPGESENITQNHPNHIGEADGARTSVSGDRFAFFSYTSPLGSKGDGYFLSARTSTGWTTQSLRPPQSTDTGQLCFGGYTVAYTPELTKGILGDGWGQGPHEPSSQAHECGHDEPLLVPGEPEGFQNLFSTDFETHTYQLVDPAPSGVEPQDAFFQAASVDLSHVVFNENAPLTPEAPPREPGATAFGDLYLWAAGVVHLVTILPDGTPARGRLANATVIGGETNEGPGAEVFTHAVSADGSRVAFLAGGALYLRLNADKNQSPIDSEGHCTDPSAGCTIQLDASEAAGEGGGGVFGWASADGSRIFFRDDRPLTANATPAAGEPDLYEFDLSAPSGHRLTDITAEPEGHANVLGLSGASEDGSTVYFVATGVLSSSQNSDGDSASASPGRPHLYVYRSGKIAFIATLDEQEDTLDWKFPELLTTSVSRDGRFLAFNSLARLTGYVNRDVNNGEPDQQVFEYDAQAEELSCASCRSSGAPPSGPAGIYLPQKLVLFFDTPGYQLRYVTDTGKVFFGTSDPLVPRDTNGQYDIYEYAGSEQHLISGGTSPAPSFFYGSTPSGNDVYFITSQQLVRSDEDSAMSVYDARVNGGFANPPQQPECSGADCAAAGSEPPAGFTPGSAVFSGPGNLVSPVSKPPGTASKPLTNKQKLAKALKACRKKPKRQRPSCERKARKRYGQRRAATKTTRRSK
jgi:hypothetical protein